MNSEQPIQAIAGYHAHIYYGPDERAAAEHVRAGIAERFTTQLGRWHDGPIGPHVRGMYQVAFAVDVFPQLVPWLMLNRQGLTILVHPETGNAYDDHVHHALWMGEKLALNAEILRQG
jgi:DOPA 4,5-dioxygenase